MDETDESSKIIRVVSEVTEEPSQASIAESQPEEEKKENPGDETLFFQDGN